MGWKEKMAAVGETTATKEKPDSEAISNTIYKINANICQTVIGWKKEYNKDAWKWICDDVNERKKAIENGAMFFTNTSFSSEPPCSSDEDRSNTVTRYGDLHFDFDSKSSVKEALDETKKIIEWFEEYSECVTTNEMEIYFSGSKGTHLKVPAKIFGEEAEKGDSLLPLVWKRIAAAIAAHLDLKTIDLSIYNMGKGRQFRIPNVKRVNGKHKIPLYPKDLDEDVETLQEMAEKPRFIEEQCPLHGVQEDKEMVKMFSFALKDVYSKERESKDLPGISDEQRDMLKNQPLPNCIETVLKQSSKSGDMNWNSLVFSVIVPYFRDRGNELDEMLEIVEPLVQNFTDSDTYNTPEKRRNEMKEKWRYLDDGQYRFSCGAVKTLCPGIDCSGCFINNENFQIVKEMNEQFAMVDYSGKHFIIYETINPMSNEMDLVFTKKSDFKIKFETDYPNNGKKTRADIWLQSPMRKYYDGIVFAPPTKNKKPDLSQYYNLWKGFSVEPRQGDWSLLKRHIKEIICNNNDEIFEWVYAWMARLVQDPGGERPGTSIVLRGDQGIGKGVFVNTLGSLFQHHYKQVAQSSHITGRFNNHMKDTLMMFVDEGFWAGDKSAEGVLKNIITEPTLNIEQKGKDLISIKNNINLIVASNSSWVVPAGLGERRFMVLDVPKTHKDDYEYFKDIMNQMNNGGREAMLYDLMHYDYSHVNLRRIKKTNALLEQQIYSMSMIQQYWFSRLQDGMLTENHEWGEMILKDTQYEDFSNWCKKQNKKHIDSNVSFGIGLGKMCPDIEEKKHTIDGKRIRKRDFPPLSKCRKEFERALGIEVQWNKEEENSNKENWCKPW